MARRISIRHAKLGYSISSNARLRDERGVFRHSFPKTGLSVVRRCREIARVGVRLSASSRIKPFFATDTASTHACACVSDGIERERRNQFAKSARAIARDELFSLVIEHCGIRVLECADHSNRDLSAGQSLPNLSNPSKWISNHGSEAWWYYQPAPETRSSAVWTPFKSAVSIPRELACCRVVKGVYQIRILQGRQIRVKNGALADAMPQVRRCRKEDNRCTRSIAPFAKAILCKRSRSRVEIRFLHWTDAPEMIIQKIPRPRAKPCKCAGPPARFLTNLRKVFRTSSPIRKSPFQAFVCVVCMELHYLLSLTACRIRKLRDTFHQTLVHV